MAKTVEVGDVAGFEPLSGADDPIHLCDVYGSEIRVGRDVAVRRPDLADPRCPSAATRLRLSVVGSDLGGGGAEGRMHGPATGEDCIGRT